MIRFILSSILLAVFRCNSVVFACTLSIRISLPFFFSVRCGGLDSVYLLAIRRRIENAFFRVSLFLFFIGRKRNAEKRKTVLWRYKEKAEAIFFSIKEILLPSA